jgi:hypothetical protein
VIRLFLATTLAVAVVWADLAKLASREENPITCSWSAVLLLFENLGSHGPPEAAKELDPQSRSLGRGWRS